MKDTADYPIVVYSPESPLRHPVRLGLDMFRDLFASRFLGWRLFVRDISAQYRQSMLGYVWAFIPPLVASLPFVFLNSQGVVSIQGTSIPYAAFAMIGTIIWQSFVDALTMPLKTITTSKAMLTRVNFPREAILLSALGQIFFNFIIRLALLVFVFIYFKLTLFPTAFLFPLGSVALIMLGFMLGILITPIGLLYNDVQQLLPILTMFLMFLTPVIYPQPKAGLAGTIAKWNPVAPLVMTTRDWLTLGASTHLLGFCVVTGCTLALLLLGWLTYRIALPHIISRIGN